MFRIWSVTLIVTYSACAQVITTVAGTDWFFPASNLPAVNAPLGRVEGVAIDSKGNLYVADSQNNMVMRISPGGVLSVVAGNGQAIFSGDGGPARSASINRPLAVAVDSNSNLYIATESRIRRVTPDGVINTVAGGPATAFSGDGGPAVNALLSAPTGIAADSAGNLYIADTSNSRIRKISPDGIIRTIAGTGAEGFSGDGGLATKATLHQPVGVAVDQGGNVYVSDTANRRIRKVAADGTISTIAGQGSRGAATDGALATNSPTGFPAGLYADDGGNIYFADLDFHRIYKVTRSGTIFTVAGGNGGFFGDGGPAVAAGLNGPQGVVGDGAGNLVIADTVNERLRLVNTGATISTVAGNGNYHFSGDGGLATNAVLSDYLAAGTYGLAIDHSGNLIVADPGNHRVRRITPAGVIDTIAGTSAAGFEGDGGPAIKASLKQPKAVATDSSGNTYIADSAIGVIRKISADGIISTFAGTGKNGPSGDGGPAIQASLFPTALAFDGQGNLYAADNARIRKIRPDGVISTVAGSEGGEPVPDGGPATAGYLIPCAIAADSAGVLFIGECLGHRVRKVTANGIISTVAGNGQRGTSGDGGQATLATLDYPTGLTIDSQGSLFIADGNSGRVRVVTPDGVIRTIAGNGSYIFSGDGGPPIAAGLANPTGLALDALGNLYIADTGHGRIRKVIAAGVAYQALPARLSFTASAGGTPTSPQTITLTSTIAGLAFATTTTTPWLSVSPATGTMPAALEVKVDPAGLAAGSYQATITIAAPNAVPASTTVAVALTVQPGAQTKLGVDSQSFAFTILEGATDSVQLRISNLGSGSLTFDAAATTTGGGNWLKVAPASGTATPAAPAILTASVSGGSLGTGTYRGTIAITGGGSTVNVPVTLSIRAPSRLILISQTALSFTAVAQGGMPLSQNFGILNTGQGSMGWTATASTLSGGNWLRISPVSGTVEQPYVDVSLATIAVDPTGLGPGDYYGRVQVSAAAVNSPQVLTVILTVLPPGSNPGPEVRPAGLIFTGPAGATPGSQDVLVSNPRGQPDSFLSGQIGSSFSYLPANATVDPAQPSTVRVYPDFSKLSAGAIQRGTITLQFSDGTARNIGVLSVVAPGSGPGASAGERRERAEPRAICSSPTLEIQFRSLRTNFVAVVGQPTTVEVQVIDDCGNLIGPDRSVGAAVQTGFSNGDGAINLTHVGNGIWTGTWRPVRGANTAVVMTVTAFASKGAQIQRNQVDLAGRLTAGNTPTVTAGGVVHSASFVAGAPVAPGALMTIYGSNLADGDGQAGALPLPQQLNGTQVRMGDRMLPLLYTSAGQINVQVPYDVPLNTQYPMTVQRGTVLSVPEPLVVSASQPGIFTVNQQGTGQGDIFKSDGVTLAQRATPACVGETVVIYGTGLGAVTPQVPEGIPPPLSPLSRTTNTPIVTIDGHEADVSFSGLVPGYPGLYQVNVVVPDGSDVGNGDEVPVILSVGGNASRTVTMRRPGPRGGTPGVRCVP